MSARIQRAAILLLLVAASACARSEVPASASAATATPLPTAAPSAAWLSTAAADLSTPTVETAPAQAASQPAAAPHFKAGDRVQLDSIAMKSRTEGWATSGPYVLTTADGARTWREVTPPQNFAPGTTDQAYGAFLDPRTAWITFAEDDHIAADASIWHTTDGGLHWTPGTPLLHQVRGDRVWVEFAVLDSRDVWALVRGVYMGAGTHYNHELFRSTDAGLTWVSLDGEISDDYTGMVFADTQFGVRTFETVGPYAASPPAYDTTNDGGANWQEHELPLPPDAPNIFNQYNYCEPYQPVVLSARSIRMLVGCFDSEFNPRHVINYFYASQDAGNSWRSVLLPDKVQAASSQLLYFGSNNALLLGRDSYRSTSDGQTWSFVKTVNWDGQFSFSDPQYGWAIATEKGETALVQTIDGAATWTVIKPTVAP
jgi:photosystem II stability/assembly factor-like uncharacterized protein